MEASHVCVRDMFTYNCNKFLHVHTYMYVCTCVLHICSIYKKQKVELLSLMYSCTVDDLDYIHVHMYMYETLGLSMEIFKYEYNLSRKNIKNNKPIHTLIV
jgi:hypothetical protein